MRATTEALAFFAAFVGEISMHWRFINRVCPRHFTPWWIIPPQKASADRSRERSLRDRPASGTRSRESSRISRMGATTEALALFAAFGLRPANLLSVSQLSQRQSHSRLRGSIPPHKASTDLSAQRTLGGRPASGTRSRESSRISRMGPRQASRLLRGIRPSPRQPTQRQSTDSAAVPFAASRFNPSL